MLIVQEYKSSYKKKTTKKKDSFIIVNTDDTGFYIHNIINRLVSNGLQEQDGRFGNRRANKIRFLDAIVIGDCESVFDYDFRVVKEQHLDTLEALDGRSFRVYDAVDDYSKILKKIEMYTRANRLGEYKYYKRYQSRRSNKCCSPIQYPSPVNINIDVRRDDVRPTFVKRDVCSFRRIDPPFNSRQKATIFSDWVKIGMHQFDIEYDCLGNEFICDASNNKYYIGEDRYGQRHLMVTR